MSGSNGGNGAEKTSKIANIKKAVGANLVSKLSMATATAALGNIGLKKAGGGRYLTKKEREAKEAHDRMVRQLREQQKRMKELEKDVEAMQQLVYDKIKNPNIKRRNSITDFSFSKPHKRFQLEATARM